MRALAALGVNVNHPDGSGQTPLSHAAENNHPDTVRASASISMLSSASELQVASIQR